MVKDGKLVIAHGESDVCLAPSMANRHGLIAGATGTGKTVTLKTIAQSLSDVGVPCLVTDVKGDVSGMAVAGKPSEKLAERLAQLGAQGLDFHASPVQFWDVFGQGGVPVRTTITEMGPVLLSRLLGLTEVQEGVLNIAFHVADDQGLLLLDLKDLRSMVAYVGEHAKELALRYGNVSPQSVGAIQRSLLALEDAGGDSFFGEPALDVMDWLACDADGHGYVNVLDCTRLVQSPLLYSTFLLWMLSELSERLPEAGDLDKPKVCLFFDEAHLIFADAPKALLDKVTQVVKLVRSKGVGVWFCTQNPQDLPEEVLAQLGNRVQHALRAYTPAEQRAVRAAADSFRENPAFKTADAIGQLATGEALVSFLDEDGVPGMVQRAWVLAPGCSMDAATADDRSYLVENARLRPKYATPLDRESAYELLNAKALQATAAAEKAKADAAAAKEAERAAQAQAKAEEAAAKKAQREAEAEERRRQRAEEAEEARRQKEAEAAVKKAEREEEQRRKRVERLAMSAATSMSRSIGTQIARGIMGALKGR